MKRKKGRERENEKSKEGFLGKCFSSVSLKPSPEKGAKKHENKVFLASFFFVWCFGWGLLWKSAA